MNLENFLNIMQGICPLGAFMFWNLFFHFLGAQPTPAWIGVKFGVEESTYSAMPNSTPISAACRPCRPKSSKLPTDEHTHTHTHPFNGPFSRTTRVSRYQKGKNQSGFYWSKRQWVAVASAGHMQVCTSLQTDNHVSTSPLGFFYEPDALPVAQPTASKHWRQKGAKKLPTEQFILSCYIPAVALRAMVPVISSLTVCLSDKLCGQVAILH